MLLSIAEHCWALLSNAEHCWALLSIAEHCWALLSNFLPEEYIFSHTYSNSFANFSEATEHFSLIPNLLGHPVESLLMVKLTLISSIINLKAVHTRTQFLKITQKISIYNVSSKVRNVHLEIKTEKFCGEVENYCWEVENYCWEVENYCWKVENYCWET